jgi:tRNA(Ile)-lysidine synthase
VTGEGAGRLADADLELIPTGPVVVALSGGPDSAVAGWLATTRSDRVRAVFVDHGWPGSAAMSAAARGVAAHLGIPIVMVPVEPTHSETKAREVRLQVLEQEAGGHLVVTGHHAGDVAETVLANLLRGAGATGLSGIPATRPPFVRPLLAVPAAEVRRAAVELGIPFADDPANADPSHHRNFVRHTVLAGLEQDAPGAAAALARSASTLGADDAALERLAADVPLYRDGGAVLIPAGILATVPGPVAARVCRRALRMANPPYPGTAADVAGVMAAVGGRTAQLSAGFLATREGPFVAIHTAAPGTPLPPQPIPVPGRVETHAGPIAAALVDLPAVPPLGTGVAWLARAVGDLTVTGAAPGDRIDLGGGHSRKATDLLADAGVPRRRRPGWPVVVAHGKIAWLVGARVGAWARPGVADPRVIELRWT